VRSCAAIPTENRPTRGVALPTQVTPVKLAHGFVISKAPFFSAWCGHVARWQLTFTAFSCLLVVVARVPAQETRPDMPRENRRPNVLMIVTDDQGAWSMGCSGNRDAHTPNMDRLAAEGVFLSQAFAVTPVCSPSRVATLTGRYASEFGIYDWINPATEPQVGLDRSASTWPEQLLAVGYRTGLVGKWHLGVQPHHHPSKFGYGDFAGFLEGGVNTLDPILTIDGLTRKRSGLCVDLLTDLALEFMQKSDPRPWCLSLHYRAPHSSYLPVDQDVWRSFVDKSVNLEDYPGLDRDLMTTKMREYLASVADIDRNLARILHFLDDRQLSDNTLVIFTSDHGYNLGHHGLEFKGNAHWRLSEAPAKKWPEIAAGRRPNMFDTSLRVPALVRFPGRITAGMQLDTLTTNLDWYPTICEAAGIPASMFEQVPLRGQSLWPELTGMPERPGLSKELYFEYSMHHGSQAAMRAIRTERWKYMRDFKHAGRIELYDLHNDPDESQNLAADPSEPHRQLISAFDAKLAEKMHEIRDNSCLPR